MDHNNGSTMSISLSSVYLTNSGVSTSPLLDPNLRSQVDGSGGLE